MDGTRQGDAASKLSRTRQGEDTTTLGRTPRERWDAAVAARPLETPRPLPVAFHAMASALTGRARPPLFTTGPNTRHALSAAGALGATTGTVVHLPAAPTPGPVVSASAVPGQAVSRSAVPGSGVSVSGVSAVLAHELTHTRSPVRRPRFFLGGASALLDDDERQALAAGRDRLGQLGDAGAGALNAGRDRLGQAADAGRDASSTGAGIVDQLPVGGGGLGGVTEVATRAARAAIIEASGSPMGSAFAGLQDAGPGLQNAAGGAFPGLQNAAGGAISGVQGAAGDAMSGLPGAAGGAVSGVEDAAGSAMGMVSDTGGSAMNAVNTAAGAGSGAASALNPDQVVEIVERRLLREIERRGGRWAGIF